MLSFLGAYQYATIDAGIDIIVAYSVFYSLLSHTVARTIVGQLLDRKILIEA